MKLISSEVYPVSAATAYARLTDFEALTHAMRANHIKVIWFRAGWPDGSETKWKLAFGFKGVHREVLAQITRVDKGHSYVVETDSDGVQAQVSVAVAAAEEGKARVTYTVDLSGQTVAARVMVQSLRLARGTLQDKLHGRLVGLTRELLKG